MRGLGHVEAMAGEDKGVPLNGATFDADLYGGGDRQGYTKELVDPDEAEDQLDDL